jgi:hydroxymethylbilane synthase
MIVRIGTRGSALALWQAHHIRDRLLGLRDAARTNRVRSPANALGSSGDGAPPNRWPQGLASEQERLAGAIEDVEIVVIRTTGDRIQNVPLSEVGGKGLFTKELEEALLADAVDLAVHSMKDMPSELPAGLSLVSVPERADPRDALVLPAGREAVSFDRALSFLGPGAVVGTSSLRRKAQLLSLRPDLRIIPLRGNVDTRLARLDGRHEGLEAILLACAGLTRLGLGHRVSLAFPPEHLVPAVGQGALALEARTARADLAELLGALAHPATRAATEAERSLLAGLEGNCQVPLAGHAVVSDGRVLLDGLVAATDGSRVLRDQVEGPVADAEALGVVLAGRLLEAGADGLLGASRNA